MGLVYSPDNIMELFKSYDNEYFCILPFVLECSSALTLKYNIHLNHPNMVYDQPIKYNSVLIGLIRNRATIIYKLDSPCWYDIENIKKMYPGKDYDEINQIIKELADSNRIIPILFEESYGIYMMNVLNDNSSDQPDPAEKPIPPDPTKPVEVRPLPARFSAPASALPPAPTTDLPPAPASAPTTVLPPVPPPVPPPASGSPPARPKASGSPTSVPEFLARQSGSSPSGSSKSRPPPSRRRSGGGTRKNKTYKTLSKRAHA